jgi:hypothetical protein
MTMLRPPVLACLLELVLATSLVAQWAEPRLAQWEAPAFEFTHPSLPGAVSDSVIPSRGDYRYEGLVFGGVVFGALGAWLGSRNFASCPLEPGVPCSGNRDRLGNGIAAGLVGAAVGGGLGYLVGRFSPKRPRPPLVLPSQPSTFTGIPDSVRQRAGYQHWRGAGIGTVAGGVVGALAGVMLVSISDGCDDCGEQWSPGRGALVLGLLGAGTGGVVGFLAGLSTPKYEWVLRER